MSLKEDPDLLREQIDDIVLTLKLRREQRQISKTAIAEAIGRTPSTITKIEGRHVGMSIETLLGFCHVLGLRLRLEPEEQAAMRERFDTELPRLMDLYLQLDDYQRGRLMGHALEMKHHPQEADRE